jgi:DNA-binding LacI/PurR family transcriptional regulator
VVTVDGSEARERFVELARSSARRVDGLIMVDLFFSPSQQAELAASGMVAVTVGVRTEFFDSFTIDNAAAAALATRHLINLGHRRLGIISGGETPGFDFTAEAGRRNGFLEALTDAGLPYLERQGGYSVVGGIEAMNTLLASTAPPTGVFAFSDEMAMGALKSLRDHGLAVPGDVSVIGFDGHELAELFGLTTIRQEVEEMAAAAVRRLLERLQSSADPERHEVFPTKLIVRASTGPAPLDRA